VNILDHGAGDLSLLAVRDRVSIFPLVILAEVEDLARVRV
jgi:hypothetical protein